MTPSDPEVSPDSFRLTIEGELFDVAYDLTQPGTYHYRRLSGPAPGYGFTSRRSDHVRSTITEHMSNVRAFLADVNPLTGYLEDSQDGNDTRSG